MVGDDHHDQKDDGEDEHDHTDAPGSGSLKPSPTESYGCEVHGDHWHCEGAVTASTTAASSAAVSSSPSGGGAAATTAGTGSTAAAQSTSSTAGAVRGQATGLTLVGLAAVIALAH